MSVAPNMMQLTLRAYSQSVDGDIEHEVLEEAITLAGDRRWLEVLALLSCRPQHALVRAHSYVSGVVDGLALAKAKDKEGS